MALNGEPVDGFFMVWTKGGRKPRFIHGTRDLARTEAERLARLHPGQKFIVLAGWEKVWTDQGPGQEVQS